jgi:hypothetical protein
MKTSSSRRGAKIEAPLLSPHRMHRMPMLSKTLIQDSKSSFDQQESILLLIQPMTMIQKKKRSIQEDTRTRRKIDTTRLEMLLLNLPERNSRQSEFRKTILEISEIRRRKRQDRSLQMLEHSILLNPKDLKMMRTLTWSLF